MKLPNFWMADNSEFPEDLFVVHTESVSYTHLDVYKRQNLYSFGNRRFDKVNDKQKREILNFDYKILNIKMKNIVVIGAGTMGNGIDVYKRQIFNRIMPF